MQYRVTNKYGWTTLKFLNGLAADLRFATATNNGMNTYDIYTVIYTTIGDARVCVCLQNWNNFCPYALISTPNVP